MFPTIKRIVLFMGVYGTLIFILSCKKDPEKKVIIKHEEKTKPKVEDDSETDFPKTGNKITDFVISPYEIQYQVEGLLDDDELEDTVIVLQDKGDKSSSRPTLVLLKQPKGGYKLQEISWVAIGPECTSEDYKIYDTEDVNLDNKELMFSMYSLGPSGNKETIYRYVQNNLILVHINTHNMGAGGQSAMDYNLLSGEIDFEEVNTMIDSMPSTTTKKVLKLKGQIFFDKDDPEIVLDTIFKMI